MIEKIKTGLIREDLLSRAKENASESRVAL